MPFRRSDEKRQEQRAREAEAQAEVDRLTALRPEALAVEVLPIIATEAAKSEFSGVGFDAICKELLGGLGASFRVNTFGLKLALKVPVLGALQRLEHANLVLQIPSRGERPARWRITADGEQAVEAGNIPDKLGQSTS